MTLIASCGAGQVAHARGGTAVGGGSGGRHTDNFKRLNKSFTKRTSGGGTVAVSGGGQGGLKKESSGTGNQQSEESKGKTLDEYMREQAPLMQLGVSID